MKRSAILTIGVFLLTAVIPAAAQSLSAEDALKVAHATLMKAVTGADVQRVAVMIHPKAIGFFRASQHAVLLEGGTDRIAIVKGILDDLGQFTTAQSSLDVTLRVVGETGVVTQTAVQQMVVSKKKVTAYLRTTAVYIRDADGWKLLSWHTSDIPLKK